MLGQEDACAPSSYQHVLGGHARPHTGGGNGAATRAGAWLGVVHVAPNWALLLLLPSSTLAESAAPVAGVEAPPPIRIFVSTELPRLPSLPVKVVPVQLACFHEDDSSLPGKCESLQGCTWSHRISGNLTIHSSS